MQNRIDFPTHTRSIGEQAPDFAFVVLFCVQTPLNFGFDECLIGGFVSDCVSDRIARFPRREQLPAVLVRRTCSEFQSVHEFGLEPDRLQHFPQAMTVQACQRRGLRVPADVAIIVGQNDEPLCERPRPSLTSIEFGFERIGYEAAQLLHSLMDGSQPPAEPTLLPPQGLIVRESTDFHAVQDELVAAALQFISTNCHCPIGQHDVAKAVHAETRTLQNRFRKHLGRAIVAEIRRVRIERAKRELTQSKKRLSDIARDVGFGDSMRMYEVFRRELNITPGQYRHRRSFRDDT
jgi:AraC-like DNA-binding protein